MLWACHHKTFKKKLKIQILVQLSRYDYRQLYLRKGGVKGAITLKPPIIFHSISIKYVLSWMTHPPKL